MGMRTLFHRPQYQGMADTIVQLIGRSVSGLIAPSRPIRPEERHCNPSGRSNEGVGVPAAQSLSRAFDTALALEPNAQRRDGEDMPEATWKPHEKHGQLTKQSDLPDSVFAFPKQRREPLTDAQHVRNAVARFDQVIDVSDAERALAFANIEKAANYYGVNLVETSWHDLGIHPQKARKEAAASAMTRERRVRS